LLRPEPAEVEIEDPAPVALKVRPSDGTESGPLDGTGSGFRPSRQLTNFLIRYIPDILIPVILQPDFLMT